MERKSKYHTKQKDIIIDYMKTVEGNHITALEIYTGLKEKGINIGQATIYRQLENLVSLGVLNKYIIDNNSPACFEYRKQKDNGESFYHCVCEGCGKITHLKCEKVEDVKEHLIEDHNFSINMNRTIFYGLCDKCKKI